MSTTRLAQQFGPHMYRHDGLAHPWLTLVFFLLVATAIGLGIWLLVRNPHHHPGYPLHPGAGWVPPAPPTDPALEALRMRFARGEIDADEYAARTALLSGATTPPRPDAP